MIWPKKRGNLSSLLVVIILLQNIKADLDFFFLSESKLFPHDKVSVTREIEREMCVLGILKIRCYWNPYQR